MAKGKGERILVVDDEPQVVNMVCQYLKLEGFTAIPCYGGKEALSKVASERPDAVILDLLMPEVDGFTVLESIKKDETKKHLTVIILTAKASEEDQLKGWKEGAAGYLVKPFDMDELVNSIVLALEERRRQILGERTYDV